MNILVTGSNGFIGRNLTSKLSTPGVKIHYYDLPTNDIRSLVTFPSNIDCIVHLAAIPGIADCEHGPEAAFSTNIEGTFNLLKAARASEVGRFIFASSAAVDSNPNSFYATTKLCSELLCKTCYPLINIDILRISNVYGFHSNHKNSVVAKFIKQILCKEPIVVHGLGDQTRSFIFANDLSSTIQSIILDQAPGINYHNLVTLQTSINYIADTLAKIGKEYLGYETEIIHSSHKAKEPKAHNPHCMVFPTSLRTGLRQTFKWFMENSTYDYQRLERPASQAC